MSTKLSNAAPTVAVTDIKPRKGLSPLAAFVASALAFVGISFAAGAPSPLYVVFQAEWHFPSWILTIAFAVYALTLLVTLLVAGSLSDHIGRRPVLIAALGLEIVAMVLFVFAPDIGWVIAARAVQGVATGAATSTFSAALVELAPPTHKKLGVLIAGIVPVGGLGLGALATGFAIQFTSIPSVIVFSFLVLFFFLGTIVVIFSPETVSRRPGAIRSLLPRLSVPKSARGEFNAAIPLLVAAWMIAGLFLGLVPSILRGVFHVSSGLVSGALVALQPAAAAIVTLLVGDVAARKTIVIGSAALIVGFGILVAGIVTGLLPLLFIGALIGGSGFGSAFSGTLRILAPLAGAHQRAELFAALLLVGYLAFGIPVVIAGQLIGRVGLFSTVLGYGIIAIAMAVIGLLVQMRLARVVTGNLVEGSEASESEGALAGESVAAEEQDAV